MFDSGSSLSIQFPTLYRSFCTKASHNLPIELCKAVGHALSAPALKVNELLSFFTPFLSSLTVSLDFQFTTFILRFAVSVSVILILSRELLEVARLAFKIMIMSRFRSCNLKLHFKCF